MDAEYRRYDVRLLVVVDGYFSLGSQDLNDRSFSVSHLISALKSTTWDKDIRIFVDTAHRDGDQNATVWGKFHFKNSLADLNYYDEIWLFGYNGWNENDQSNIKFSHALDEDELKALGDFMQNGGGVLADGDHDGLGSFMCGRIPRVKTMRKWFAEKDKTDYAVKTLGKFDDPKFRNWPATGKNRADTLVADHNGKYNFTNQSDDRPQELALVPMPDTGKHHPLFDIGGSTLVLKEFPDHFHEGEVLGFGGVEHSKPWSVNETFETSKSEERVPEYPLRADGEQELPQVIAKGKVTGGHTTLVEPDKLCNSGFRPDDCPTAAKMINTLAVFDGRKCAIKVGRVLTDSSFHHFVDLNLIGDPCATGNKTKGFGNVFLEDMKLFYLNCVVWLANERVWARAPHRVPNRFKPLI